MSDLCSRCAHATETLAHGVAPCDPVACVVPIVPPVGGYAHAYAWWKPVANDAVGREKQ